MPGRNLSDYSTDALLYELLRLTRRQQWEAEPLRFAREVFPQHFSKPPAPMHQVILDLMVGARSVANLTPGVRELHPPIATTLPFSPPVSPSHPEHPNQDPDSVQPMNTTA